MQAAIPQVNYSSHFLQAAGWKRGIAAVAAILLGIIFLVSGAYKVLNPLQTGELLEQAQVHAGWGAVGAATLGTVELFTAFLLFVPRFRRWGGLLGSALLIFFIGWMAFYYNVLAGHECSCFPLIKRTVGPNFFIGDAVMLLMGFAAFAWSPLARSLKIPLLALGSLALVATTSFAINKLRPVEVPTSVVVDGKPQNLANGKVFLFFYDPECMHCDAASRYMSKLKWTDAKIVAIPTHDPQFAASFLKDTGLPASTSLDVEKLRKAFSFVDPPYGVALVDGHVKQRFGQAQFNAPSPGPDLKRLQFVQ